MFRPWNGQGETLSVASEGAVNETSEKSQRNMCTASLPFTHAAAFESWRSRKIAFVPALEWL
jgi:hypothetical protein